MDVNTNLKYIVKQVDEATKNHQSDTDKVTAHMPEITGSKFCPVYSLVKYLNKLHPRSDYLWQHPKDKAKIHDHDIWYKVTHLGDNPL